MPANSASLPSSSGRRCGYGTWLSRWSGRTLHPAGPRRPATPTIQFSPAGLYPNLPTPKRLPSPLFGVQASACAVSLLLLLSFPPTRYFGFSDK